VTRLETYARTSGSTISLLPSANSIMTRWWWIDIQNIKNRVSVEPLNALGLEDGRRVASSRDPCLQSSSVVLSVGARAYAEGHSNTGGLNLGKLQPFPDLNFFDPRNHIDKMLTPTLKRQVLQCSKHARRFSSSPIIATREVKRLGVIGAGQMVTLPPVTSLSRCSC
jgi:hypothetical protein